MSIHGSVVGSEPCPKCQSQDNVKRYEDGYAKCFSIDCGFWESNGEGHTTTKKKETNLLTDLEYTSIPARALNLESCQKWAYGSTTHKGKRVQVAQYKDSKGHVVAQKVRDRNKDFFILGDAKLMGLFGMNLWQKGGKRIVVTEGEIDAISISQVQGHSWPVVSIPNGCSAAARSIKANIDWLESFDEVVLAFDMDEPGRKATEECAPLIRPGKCKIWDIPMKDANEMLVAGKVAELKQAIWQARTFQPGGIISGSDVTLDSLRKASSPGYSIPYKELSDKLHGLRRGELTILTAGSGIGKSTAARELAYYLRMEYGHKIGNIFLEESVPKTAQGYIAINQNIPLGVLRGNPDILSEAQWTKSKIEVIDGNMFFYQHFGSLESEELFGKLKYLISAMGVEWIVLDHISILVSGLTSESGEGERKDIDILMTRLRSLIEETGVGIIAIVHLSNPEGKAHEEGGRVTLAQLRGSGSLRQLSDNVAAMERDQQSKSSSDVSMWRVLKCREWGETGEAGYVIYDRKTGRLNHLDKAFAEKFVKTNQPEGGDY